METDKQSALKRVDAARHRTPLFLYSLAVLFFISLFPPVDSVFESEGWAKLSRFCICVLFVYVAVLIQERQRLSATFREVLAAFQSFHRGKAPDPQVEHEAVSILISSLQGADEELKQKVHAQLVRLTGQDLPPEHEAWDRWWRERQQAAGDGS